MLRVRGMLGRVFHDIAVPLLAAILSVYSAGCTDRCSTPEPAEYTLSGHLRLVGTLRSEHFTVLGDTTVHNAGGVAVYLAVGDSLIDSTATEEGFYVFEGLHRGTYRVLARAGPVPAFALAVNIEDEDVVVRDTLTLWSTGGLVDACPNPFNPSLDEHSSVVYFPQETGYVTITIHDMANRRIRTLIERELRGGPNIEIWDGTGDKGELVSGGSYWAVMRVGDLYGWDLVLVQAQGG